ncbi:MAG: Mur ligase family protein, partial [Actinomycetaceae bacterium UMB1218B]|nr:Mur ligase family protein [Actinomycetaceae bacterium UMB1218B]
MSNDHSAFFGDSEEEAVAGSIPADLIPYLEAADEPDEVALTDVTDHGQDAEEAELHTALRNLVESSLLLGPDPSILAELEGDIDEDFADDAEAARAEHEEALAKAADSVELDATVAQIYESIVERAPEHDIEPSLDRIRMLLDILGDPQNTFPTVHITGTNGKTSTARMIDAVLTAFGVRVGRFTSPHLIDVRERISIEGIPI